MAGEIDRFTDLVVCVSDGNTVPSTEIAGHRTFVDIGSGTVLKLSWSTPVANNNEVNYYSLYISSFSIMTGSSIVLNSAIGNVNEFYINSDMLRNINLDHYQLNIYLTAHSKQGTEYDYTSELCTTYISKGCGTYIKVDSGYAKPIMKRAIAFAKLKHVALFDADGKALLDSQGKALYAKAAGTQDTDQGWALMQEFHSKNKFSEWKQSDIRYEVLVDSSGEIITDFNDEPIYVL